MAEQGRSGFDSQFQDTNPPATSSPSGCSACSLTCLSALHSKVWGAPTPFISNVFSPAKMEQDIGCRRCLHSEVQMRTKKISKIVSTILVLWEKEGRHIKFSKQKNKIIHGRS